MIKGKLTNLDDVDRLLVRLDLDVGGLGRRRLAHLDPKLVSVGSTLAEGSSRGRWRVHLQRRIPFYAGSNPFSQPLKLLEGFGKSRNE